MTVLERIKARSVVTDAGCWEWQGSKVGPYGRTKVGSRTDGSRRNVLVHVATWEAVNGPVPHGKELDHVVCDNPPCANPEHVKLATSRENTLRSKTSPTAVNARKAVCPKCEGPYTTHPDGTRHCQPCRLAYFRAYNARRPGCSRALGCR